LGVTKDSKAGTLFLRGSFRVSFDKSGKGVKKNERPDRDVMREFKVQKIEQAGGGAAILPRDPLTGG